MDYRSEYQAWCKYATEDDLQANLLQYGEEEIKDAFYRDLEFGTGGLRGILGAGTNRMNVYTVAKATQGLANYLYKKHGNKASVVIGFDSRLKSELFARTAASVFVANGIYVHLWPKLNPVSTVSFATRFLVASAGVMITASHNPSQYNGYKVYGQDGCQITTEVAKAVLCEMEKLDIFKDIKKRNFDLIFDTDKIQFIKEEVLTAFLEKVKGQTQLYGEEIDKNISIVYTPLNGTGYIPVTRVLEESGFKNITVVEEQRLPDGNFPTCPYPNPEEAETLALGLEYCREIKADILLATDPDCDRVGIAVKNKQEEYVLLSGNETGILLLDYICSQKEKHKKMPKKPVMFKTIVSLEMAEEIAKHYGVESIDVLTGFKYIGEQIGFLEKKNQSSRFIFGFEESYGYLSGDYVRDKDGVGASYLICEMIAYYKSKGIELWDKLQDLYRMYGYYLNTLHSYLFTGALGADKMKITIQKFNDNLKVGGEFAGLKITNIVDYSFGVDGLPKSNVLKICMEEKCSVIIRPSGTEPKLKLYFSVREENYEKAKMEEQRILQCINKYFD
jgi:hypothetical protein